MTPKFFGFLWTLYFTSAGLLWLGNAFTLLTAVVFGFIGFGLVWAGMMCVLPGLVSHGPVTNAISTTPATAHKPMPERTKSAAIGISAYRSA